MFSAPMERIPGVSEAEWNALPPAIRVFIEIRITELEAQNDLTCSRRIKCRLVHLAVPFVTSAFTRGDRKSNTFQLQTGVANELKRGTSTKTGEV